MPPFPPGNASPTIDVEFFGITGRQNPPRKYTALIDTGFTGGVSIPIIQALPLGLVLRTTANFTLADGSVDSTYICMGMAMMGNIAKAVTFSLSKGNEILIGTEFLDTFKVKMELDYKTKLFVFVEQP